jgi:RNA polymerase sigma-70 factor (ECF subfamily)
VKIVHLQQDFSDLLKRVSEGHRIAQKMLFQQFSARILSICRQYITDDFVVEDMMLTVFVKIFKNLNTFENKGVFEAWIRRIAVNECISYIRSKKKISFIEPNEETITASHQTDAALMQADLQAMIDALPEGCKMVFVLYAVEGYKHHEISEMLGINEGTSKSQLSYARRILQQKIEQSEKVNHG